MVFNFSQQATLAILFFLIVWLTIISLALFKLTKHYNRLTQGINKAKLAEVLDKIISDLKNSDQKISDLVKKTDELEKIGLTHIQKVGLLRFNPFAEVGGDQSFVFALLDEENNGIVMTSMTSRTGTRWYGKTVRDGMGVEHELSKEEKEAIAKANKK